MQRHLFIDDFHPSFHYIKGVDNVIADALSHLPQIDDSITILELIPPKVLYNTTEASPIGFDNDTFLVSLIYYPNLTNEIIFPLEYSNICHYVVAKY